MYRSLYVQKLGEEFQDIFSVQPNDLGNKQLTSLYKFITGPLKKMPFLYIIPLSFVASISLYIVFGHLVIQLVSLLQNGF